MKTSQKFRVFCKSLIVDNKDSISKRRASITKRLNNDFWGVRIENRHSFYAGSHGRHTATRGSSDIDIVFMLPSKLLSRYKSHRGNGQSALLQMVNGSVSTPLWRTSIRGDGQVIVVRFSDGMKFEIVPCFLGKDGLYIYPDSNNGGTWKHMNPKSEFAAFSLIDKETIGKLRDLCRMARAWRAKWNLSISGILIDTLAYNFIQKRQRYRDKGYLKYSYLTQDFFKYLAHQNSNQSYWLAPGSRQRVYRRVNFEAKARRCYNHINEAIKNELKGSSYSASLAWRKVFGSRFP